MTAELYTEQDRCRQASLHGETVAALPRRRSTGRERLDEPQRNWGGGDSTRGDETGVDRRPGADAWPRVASSPA